MGVWARAFDVIQGTFDVIQETFGVIQGTFGVIMGLGFTRRLVLVEDLCGALVTSSSESIVTEYGSTLSPMRK